MARAADFDLAKALATPSFTPGRRDAAPLVALIVAGADPTTTTRATTALAKLPEVAGEAIAAAWDANDDGARARLVGALGLVARGGGGGTARLIEFAADRGPRVRRAAIVALGKLAPDAAIIDALVGRWEAAETTVEERRALVDALGKLGGDAVLGRLRAFDPGDDRELARRRDRAVLVADRDARREQASAIATDVAPPRPLVVRLGCRAGLAGLLADELRALGFSPRGCGDRAVEVQLAAPWSALYASRLWVAAGVRVPISGTDAASITRAIVAPEVHGLFAAWTRGAIRWRLGFTHGHKRALVWEVARDVTRAAPELINDPTETTWDVLIDLEGQMLELVPRRAADPRFAWRVAEVPAASHPTIAAALARVAGVRAEDACWDPFCGSGGELAERAMLGPYRAMRGTDVDAAALEAARANLAQTARVTLAIADARKDTGEPVDLVITNPPLGSRVQVDAAGLLVDCLPSFARRLAPRGRLVWITPSSRRTSVAAERAGLVRSVDLPVDLGGVRGHLERWDKP